MSAADFRVIFDRLPGLFVVVRADAGFTVAAASDAYLEVVSRQRDDVVGRSFFDVLPDFAREQDSDALAQFSTHDPDAVVLDIGMPGMDGYEVARRLRSAFPDSRAILIALSGWGQDEDRRRAREAGFDHHLVKPADIAALRAVLAPLDGDAPRD